MQVERCRQVQASPPSDTPAFMAMHSLLRMCKNAPGQYKQTKCLGHRIISIPRIATAYAWTSISRHACATRDCRPHHMHMYPTMIQLHLFLSYWDECSLVSATFTTTLSHVACPNMCRLLQPTCGQPAHLPQNGCLHHSNKIAMLATIPTCMSIHHYAQSVQNMYRVGTPSTHSPLETLALCFIVQLRHLHLLLPILE